VDVKKVKSVLSILHVAQHPHNVKAQAKEKPGVKQSKKLFNKSLKRNINET
jgi:hypothetical protein